ncbi:ceramide-1-phosphate transfer protein-like [Saccostrea echinata]|uniref:ceramide-1-phosphate transfer protein-like n=1 Tax=Saccostrea echinata TaxID=191078 RepID=UPI002A81639C|nr:ceramide-1-phosphate transfer protein-like [Saccostrea echinata]
MSTEEFNLEKLDSLFAKCKDGDVVVMDAYVDAYEELSKLFSLLGSVFGFVTSDVVEKIGILREYRSSEVSEKYVSIQSMIQYEVETKTTNNKKKASGSRTLLRLHRALEFTSRLLSDLKIADEHEKMSSLTKTAYDDTLARHHPWLIRKGVHVAVYTLPSRKHFLEKLKVEDIEKAKDLLGRVSDVQKEIFIITEELYAKENLLDLP